MMFVVFLNIWMKMMQTTNKKNWIKLVLNVINFIITIIRIQFFLIIIILFRSSLGWKYSNEKQSMMAIEKIKVIIKSFYTLCSCCRAIRKRKTLKFLLHHRPDHCRLSSSSYEEEEEGWWQGQQQQQRVSKRENDIQRFEENNFFRLFFIIIIKWQIREFW